MSGAAPIDLVVTHHLNTHRSGVARFNAILAERLGVEVASLWDEWDRAQCPLLSFKLEELSTEESARLAERLGELPEGVRLRLFLHTFSGLELERRLIDRAELVYSGNDDVRAEVEALGARVEPMWSPGTISDTRPYEPAEVEVFSFGMAHKLRADEYERLRELLEALGRSYALYISNANHETATMGEADVVQDEMLRIFGEDRIYFLGHLSDVAVYNQLVRATYFAAFFKEGVRANNSTVVTAMEHGAVVVTNLDEHSPGYLRHMHNVIDVNACDALPDDALVRKRISIAAMETAQGLGWEAFTRRLRERG